MADRADERHGAGGRGAHHDLVAEGEEILHRPAAPGHHDDVERFAAQSTNPGGQRRRRGGPLYRCEVFPDHDSGKAGAGRSGEVGPGVASRSGQESDPEREKGEGTFPSRIEQAFALEARLPFQEFLEQRPDPGLLEALDLKLVAALPLVQAQPAEGANPVPRLGSEGEAPGVSGPRHGFEDGCFFAKGQVEVAASRAAHLGKFPLDPKAPGKSVLEHLADAGADFPDRVRGPGRPRPGCGYRLDPGFRRRRGNGRGRRRRLSEERAARHRPPDAIPAEDLGLAACGGTRVSAEAGEAPG